MGEFGLQELLDVIYDDMAVTYILMGEAIPRILRTHMNRGSTECNYPGPASANQSSSPISK